MPIEFEFLSPDDLPALLGLTHPELLGTAHLVLSELGYKVHAPATHEEFLSRFAQTQYHLVVIEECFACAEQHENTALINLQLMPMQLRRHATVLLIGPSYSSMHSMQAYQQSVHAVVNPVDIINLKPIIQKTVADTNALYQVFRDTQQRMAKGAA
ncbi:MAG TPA: hypothetical protein VHH73_15790 [Verrucomicrobiae bacterium]|nr:hypothetical protein [Verrucomicrobiae bacterium]